MKNSIRLHPEHGLNPTLPKCWWCGEDTGEIALLGAAYKGAAPTHMVIDKNPCDKCKAGMAKGITVMEADEIPPHAATGRWVVITEEACRRVFPEAEAGGVYEDGKRGMKVNKFIFDQLAASFEAAKSEGGTPS